MAEDKHEEKDELNEDSADKNEKNDAPTEIKPVIEAKETNTATDEGPSSGKKSDAESLFGDSSDEEEKQDTPKPVEQEKPAQIDVKKNDDNDSLFGDSSDDEDIEPKPAPDTAKNAADDGSNSDSSSKSQNGGKKRRLRKGGSKSKEKESSAFIDSDDDNPDIAQSYARQREYESDEDPFGEENQNLDDEDLNRAGSLNEDDGDDFEAILKRLKAKGKKKGDGMTESEREDFVRTMVSKMDSAHHKDLDCRRNGKPGLHKLKMLNSVMAALKKGNLQIIFLETGLLMCLGQWLRPSIVDGALPDLTLRNQMYDILFKLPIESDHLRSSQFGKVISYLKDCPKETSFNREKLRKLIQGWSRMIFGKTDNFKMLEQMQSAGGELVSSSAKRSSKPRASPGKSNDIMSRVRKTDESQPQGQVRIRAQIPQPRDLRFKRRIQENPEFTPSPRKTAKISRHDNLERRIKSKKAKRK